MNRPTDRPYTIGLYLHICQRLGIPLEDLELMDYGTIMDIIIERSNDDAEYATLATQEDFDRF